MVTLANRFALSNKLPFQGGRPAETPNNGTPDSRGIPVTIHATSIVTIVVPSAAPQRSHIFTLKIIIGPFIFCGSIWVGLEPGVSGFGCTPLPNVAGAIECAVGTCPGWIDTYWRDAINYLLSLTRIQAAGLEFIAPRILPPINASGPLLPLSLGGQAVLPACFSTQPAAISHTFIPANPNHGLAGLIEASI